jgi:hypothetical protein
MNMGYGGFPNQGGFGGNNDPMKKERLRLKMTNEEK